MTPLMLRSLASERDSNPSTLRLPNFTLSSPMRISPAAALDERRAQRRRDSNLYNNALDTADKEPTAPTVASIIKLL